MTTSGSAVVLGAGGLGGAALLTIAASGALVRVLDGGVVAEEDLSLSPLFSQKDLGRGRAAAAAEALRTLFPKIEVQTLESGSDRGELTALLLDASVAVETFALPSDKLLAGLAALRAGVPMVHAAVLRSHVQVLTVRPGQSGGCLRCLYEVLPVQGAIPAAALVGVLGPVVALAGALAGAEALRLLRGDKGAYEGHQANLDASTAAFRLVRIARRPGCPACGGAPGTDSLEPR